MANQRPSHDRELLIQSLEKSLCEDSGDTCQLGSPGLGQKKSYEAEEKKTYSGDGRSTKTGLEGTFLLLLPDTSAAWTVSLQR